MAIALVALGGMGVAGYLTSVHYASTPLACSASGVLNCEQVLTSRYSEVLGVPWSVGGIVWFGVSFALALAALVNAREASSLHIMQAAWSLVGLAVVAYLVAVELAALNHICIWCTSMHVLVVITLLLVLIRRPDVMEDETT
jgi:uncharacterized membrane protein